MNKTPPLPLPSSTKMTFVYTGKGRKGGGNDDSPRECAKQACNIQWCLARSNHKQEVCQPFIDEWKACRDKHAELKAKKEEKKEKE
jgi:hypothetical protein